MSSAAEAYLDDVPATEPQFDFDLIGTALAAVLERPSEGATVVGIHGPWGSGKTTLMYAIGEALRTRADSPVPIVIEFNAWKYQAKEVLWRALILRLVGELEQRGGSTAALEELKSSLYRAFEVQEVGPLSVNWRNMAVEIVSVGFEVLQLGVVGRIMRRLFGRKAKKTEDAVLGSDDIEQIGTALERETVSRHLAQVISIEQFLDAFRDLIAELTDSGQRIVVLIDDLDRCLPESALEVFEAIKLFLDAPGCGFVVAVDREVIRNGLAIRYAPMLGMTSSAAVADADEYIEKTIAISYDVPRLSRDDVAVLIDRASLPIDLGAEERVIIGHALGRNPRRVKRFLNLLRLQTDLAKLAAERGHQVPGPLRGNGEPAELTLLVKLMLIGYRYPFLLRQAGGPALLVELQRIITSHVTANDPVQADAALKDGFARLPSSLAPLIGNRELHDLMAMGPSLHERKHLQKISLYLDWFRRTGVDREPDGGAEVPAAGDPVER